MLNTQTWSSYNHSNKPPFLNEQSSDNNLPKNTAITYNKIALSYNDDPFTTAMFLAEKDKVINLLDIQDSDTVLDYWCWTWKYIELFWKNRSWKTVWMDISSEMIEEAKRNNHNLNIDYILWDTSTLSKIPDNSFDKINSAQVLKFITSQEDLNVLFKELYRILKPWWSFVFTNNHPNRNFDWEDFKLKPNPNYSEESNQEVDMKLHTLEDYEKACQTSWFKVESINDVEIDEKVWDLFEEESFKKVNGKRFVIAIKLTKPKNNMKQTMNLQEVLQENLNLTEQNVKRINLLKTKELQGIYKSQLDFLNDSRLKDINIAIVPDDLWIKWNQPSESSAENQLILFRQSYFESINNTDDIAWLTHELTHCQRLFDSKDTDEYQQDMQTFAFSNLESKYPYPNNLVEQVTFSKQFHYLKEQGKNRNDILILLSDYYSEEDMPFFNRLLDTIYN